MNRVSGTLLTGLFISTIVIAAFVLNLSDIRSLATVTLNYGEFKVLEQIPSDDLIPKTNLYFVGDIMLGRDVEQTLLQNGLDYPYANISFDSKTDIVVANFEAAIPEVHIKTPNNTFRFSVDKRLLPPLRAAGFTHLSLANNHTFDYGVTGFENTQETLTDNNFITFGHSTIFATSSVAFVSHGGKKIALIALHVLFTTPQDSVLESVVTQAVENSDVQILYIHWGNEYALQHSGEQELLATKLASLGVDIVVGHHPHVVQDISKIGNMLVFYSLGNYIFDQYFSIPVQQGLVLKLDESLNISLLPVSSEEKRASPSYLDGEKRAIFLQNLAERSDAALFEQIKSGFITYSNMLATSTEVAIMAQ